MLYLFDMDGTLISNYMDSPNRDKDYDRVELLPGRRECLRQLHAQGHKLGIVTNQGGVAFGYVTAKQAVEKIERVISYLGVPMSMHYCLSDRRGKEPWNSPQDANRRKPSGEMIREAMLHYGVDNPQKVIMVGDRQEDCDAADNAGVVFIWASDSFGAEGETELEVAPNDSETTILPKRNMLYVENPDSTVGELTARIIDLDTGILYDRGDNILVVSSLSGYNMIARHDGEASTRLWAALKSMATVV